MDGKLRILGLILMAVLGVPVSVIYQANIQNWANQNGLDSILTKGAAAMAANPYGLPLLIALLLVTGATLGLWAEFWVRKRFPSKPSSKKQLIEGRTFRHQRVTVDGKDFKNCCFEGVTLVLRGTAAYGFDSCNFIGPFSIDFSEPKLSMAVGLVNLAHSLKMPIIFPGEADVADKPTL